MSAKELFYSKDHSFTQDEACAYAREDLIYNVTEDILVQMEDLAITKVELARRLKKSRAYVSQLLSGSRNMTLASLADICFALGIQPKIELLPDVATAQQESSSVEKTIKYAKDTWQIEAIEDLTPNPVILESNVIDCRNLSAWEAA